MCIQINALCLRLELIYLEHSLQSFKYELKSSLHITTSGW